MLFHFQKQQNSQKPGSIHATYLISGLTAATALATSSQNGTADGEDTFMQSSPFMSSSMPQQDNEDESLAVRIVAMCREEDLEGNNFRLRQVSECGKLNVLVEIDARTYFQQLVSIHIYSLAPSTIRVSPAAPY